MIQAERLLEQAERLIAEGAMGASQEDLRRAVSAAYYALSHQCLPAAADELVGAVTRASDLYVLAYRIVDHRRLRELYVEYAKPKPSKRYTAYLSADDLDHSLVAYAGMLLELYQLRASADCDPDRSLAGQDAGAALDTARTAAARFEAADPEKRRRFLILLHVPPR